MALKALCILALVGAVAAQYNYPKPPNNEYLPPTTRPTRPPTTPPYESDKKVAGEGLDVDDGWEDGMPFDFRYAVKEDDGNDFSHNAESDGQVVKGEYRVLLPDGRTQVVRYTADWKNGYNAEITYEGEAIVTPPPPPRPTTRRPTPPPQTRPPPPPTRPVTRPPPPPTRPPTTTRNPYDSSIDNDSQFLSPSTTRRPTTGYTYTPPPPPTTRRPPPPPPPTTRRPPPPPPTTRRPPPPPPTTRRPPPPPPPTTRRPTTGYTYPTPTTRTTRPPPPPPPVPTGLYGAPDVPFGVRNNPKFGYSK